MWKKITIQNDKIWHDESYQFQANTNFTLKRAKSDNVWYLCNQYNNKTTLFDESDIEEVKSKAFNHIISRFFEDIIRSASASVQMIEILDQTIKNSIDLGKSDVVIDSNGKQQPFALDTLSAVLKQNCIELILKAKITNFLGDE